MACVLFLMRMSVSVSHAYLCDVCLCALCGPEQSRPTTKELRLLRAKVTLLEQQVQEAGQASGMVGRDMRSRLEAADEDRATHRRLSSTRALVQRDKATHRMQVRVW